jgi:exodeoxyribonuclease V alpha subunit
MFFGRDSAEKIEADPYRLLSFCAGWREVDALALNEFGIDEQDPRRLQGAVEEALYRLFDAGHTCARLSMLADRLRAILQVKGASHSWESLAADVLTEGFSNGSFVIGADHDIHPVGPLVMETTVARAVAARLKRVSESQLLTAQEVKDCIAAYERSEGIELNAEQRLAIETTAANGFAVITGGAGVGKTTVLKGLYQIYDQAGVRVSQMALAGRAAKRMHEATGRPASTIAGFLRNTAAEELEEPAVVVVDEASMCDIITMYRLCELLPPHVRLVLVGDPAQLMPVGPGLVLHALAKTPGIPAVELTVVKRYGGQIAQVAHAVRSGVFPELPADESAPITFIPCTRPGAGYSEGASEIAQTVLRLYALAPEKTQILSARRSGAGGVIELNELCQKRMTADAQPLTVWSDIHQSVVRAGFRVGDLLLCTRNLWDHGLQNGSLGQLVQIEDPPRLLTNNSGEPIGQAIAWAQWDDGERRPIFEPMLDDLELGYAITVHKAQGSQWPRVVVPITGSRLLDRTLIYTAITRAQEQVILVGDGEALQRAVEAAPRSHERHVALGSLLRSHIREIFI